MTTPLTKPSLKDRLVNWLRKQGDWVSSGQIQRVVMDNTTYTPANVARRLRELENESVIEVKYEKGHSWYKFKKFTNQDVEAMFNAL